MQWKGYRMSARRVARSRGFIIAAVAASALLLTLAIPVAAAPASAPSGGSDPALADHVAVCNVTFDAEGNVLLNGSALGAAETAALDALLAGDAGLAAALEAAADADATTCINLAILINGALAIVINADIEACGDVVFTAETVTVGGVEISSDLLDSELTNILEAAAAADVEACVEVTVTDNEVVVVASVSICAAATLLDTGAVSVDIGGEEFIFDGTIVSGGALLDVGVTVQVSLLIIGELDITEETVALVLAVAECAAAATPTPTPTPPGAGGGAGGGATPTPVPLLPNTSAGSVDPTALVVAMLMVVLLASMAVVAMRGPRRS